MRLPSADWLAQAQRLAVGESRRVRHGREPTAAMTVENLPDRWVAYCHRCNAGGVVMKAHATLSPVPDQHRFMPWPDDAKPFDDWPLHMREPLYSFLLSKGVDRQSMFPEQPLWYSHKQGRLLFGTTQGWIGRATRGQAPKWAGYGFPAPSYGAPVGDPWHPYCLVTEDYLSTLKARWAVRGLPIRVHACLGTVLRDKHLADLLEHGTTHLLAFMDGDPAGAKGAANVTRRARGLGLRARSIVCPEGKDPKDLSYEELRECTLNACTNLTA